MDFHCYDSFINVSIMDHMSQEVRSLTAIFSGVQQGTVDSLELATLLVATNSVT